MKYVVVSTLFGTLASCGGKTEAVDSAGVVFCDEIPDVTYESFTEGFFLENCQGCHSSTAQDRHGAPESVTFDTEAEIWSWATEIEATALSSNPTMPPSYSIYEDELVRLQWWLDCGLWEM